MRMYVAYVRKQTWQRQRDRQTDKEKDDNRAQGIVPYLFFLLKETVCKKHDQSSQSSIWVEIKNIFLILI